MLTFKELQERINIAKTKMGDVIKDFQDSDAPQFKGKSAEKRRQMAIAAKLEADRGVKEEVEDLDEGKWNYPKHMTKTVTTSDMDTTNAARNREERKAFRKKEKAKAHAALMKGMRKEEVEVELDEVEELEELSTEKLAWYKKHAEKSADKEMAKSTKSYGKAAVLRGRGKSDAAKPYDAAGSKHYNKSLNRTAGLAAARKKLNNEEVEQTDEELKGNQHKIDANKNGKVDGHDFKILRNAKKARYQ